MTTNSQLLTNEPKRKEKQQKLSKQPEQDRNQRNGHYMEGFQWGGGREEWGEKVQGRRSIIGRHKIDRELSLIHISEPTRQYATSRMPSSA